VDRLVTSGDVNLSNTKLTGFGLADKLAVLRTFTGIKSSPDTVIQTLSSNLHIAPDGIRTDDLKLVVPGLGEIAGAGTISPNGALNFKLVAQLAQTGVGNVLSSLAQRAGVGGAVGKGLPFMVQGTTAAPVFIPDTTAIARQALATQGQPNAQGGQAITPKNLGNALGGLFGKKKNQ
jgi:AsmA protein